MKNKDILEYNRRLNKMVLIKNCITLICFTTLSIIFNKWWIILFSALFMTYTEKVDNNENRR